MISVFDQCSDSCGWIAAIISTFAFGSFGVPIKTSVKVEVDPLVMQSYKVFVCFITSFLVIFLGEEVRWTPWGIVSGMFWVPGAACGIYGIRNAGLAIAVGTWSSIIVISSFFWGFIIFHEPVRDFYATVCAFALLICGLIGMSQYAKPTAPPATIKEITDDHEQVKLIKEDEPDEAAIAAASFRKRGTKDERSLDQPESPPPAPKAKIVPMEISEPAIVKKATIPPKDRVIFCGGRIALTRRQLGIMGAVINGAWGGTCLIPMHFASQQGFGGAGYLISFASGSLFVLGWIWLAIYCFYFYQSGGNYQEAYESLPGFHLKELWKPGILAGSLFSLGNFASIMAVSFLGQGVGYSFCQCSILVSGLWGIFYYKEISGADRIAKWFVSAIVTVVGIVWLSYEHQGGMAH